MYTKLPSFVFGFHGCDKATKEAVLYRGADLAPSTNAYDWLGSGIYFWEQNERRAMEFATLSKEHPGIYTSKPIGEPAVLGAVIDLGNCMNLMDAAHITLLEKGYSHLEFITRLAEEEMPANTGKSNDRPVRKLDRAVIEALHQYMKETPGYVPYDTVRGLFVEGEPVYPGGGFREKTHIQICVRNTNCIKAYFDPRKLSRSPYIV